MASFIEAAKDAVKANVCLALAASDTLVGLQRRAIGLDPNLFNIAGSLRKSLCNNPDVPAPEVPFPGGQCPGQLYNYTATATSVNNLGQTNNTTVTLGSTNRIQGPVTFVGVEETSSDFVVRARNAAGSIRTFRFLSSGVDAIYSKPTTQSVSLSNITVSPTDGCGNPDPNIPDPIDRTTQPVSITYETNEGDTVVENGDLNIFAPIIGSFNRVVVPISLEIGELTLLGELGLDGTIEFNLPGAYGSGNSDDPPDTDEEDATGNPRIIGAYVTTTVISSQYQGTELLGDDGPDLYVPRLGTLSFLVKGSSAFAWLPDYDVRVKNAYFAVPDGMVAYQVRATPYRGVTWIVTPVYGDPQ